MTTPFKFDLTELLNDSLKEHKNVHGYLSHRLKEGEHVQGWFDDTVAIIFRIEKALVPEAKPEPQIAKGHNPDKLTVEQVGEGWRLLDEDEIKKRVLPTTKIHDWERRLSRWMDSGAYGSDGTLTYRTRLTREELAALDAPKEESDYAALEREHLGDPEKGTGIYWKPSPLHTFIVCGFTHGKAVAL